MPSMSPRYCLLQGCMDHSLSGLWGNFPAAIERRGNKLGGLKDIHVDAKTRTWRWLCYVAYSLDSKSGVELREE